MRISAVNLLTYLQLDLVESSQILGLSIKVRCARTFKFSHILEMYSENCIDCLPLKSSFSFLFVPRCIVDCTRLKYEFFYFYLSIGATPLYL